MSEIQDAAQIIKVSFEGAEIILKMGNTGWQFVKDICNLRFQNNYKVLIQNLELLQYYSVSKLYLVLDALVSLLHY